MKGLNQKMLFLLSYLSHHPLLSFLFAVSSGWAAYYLILIAQVPRLASNPRYRGFLLKHCPSLIGRFWPTWWCWGGRTQTIVRVLLKSHPPVPYTREIVTLADGGQIGLDWSENSDSADQVSYTKPIVLILPGLVGSSQESYALHLVKQATEAGYSAVVFNFRGNGGVELKTPRTYNACNTDDLTAVIQHIKNHRPDAPMAAVGLSLGGLVLANYLAKVGRETALVAAMTISVAWNVFEASKSLEEPLNSFLFNKRLAASLTDALKRYTHMFETQYDMNKIYKSQTIREFDDNFTCKQFGYPTYREYYDDTTLENKVHSVQIPTLCLNAADDPFSPLHAIPVAEAANSENVAIVVTSHGGHIAFLEGGFPRHTSYMDRLFREFMVAIFRHRGELGRVLG